MTKRIDLFDSTYSHFTDQVLDLVRKETFGTDIGQNSWVTVDEYDVRYFRFFAKNWTATGHDSFAALRFAPPAPAWAPMNPWPAPS